LNSNGDATAIVVLCFGTLGSDHVAVASPSLIGIGAIAAPSSPQVARADGSRMNLVEYASAQKAQTVRTDMNIGVLAKLQNQQKQEGRAAVSLIESSGLRPGASEPGKGARLDVRA